MRRSESDRASAAGASATEIRTRVGAYDWRRVADDLDARGHARLPGLLAPAECRALSALYADAGRFRSRVVLRRHGFGEGEYQYFDNPLPPLVARLRSAFYARLAPIANRWLESLRDASRYPPGHRAFLARCRDSGQRRPTPLLLRYTADGYNRLHQDLYGDVAFPLQVACLLSRPRRDFTGGAFLLLEQTPRMQSRCEAIDLELGEGIVFPTAERPVEGARGFYRARMRHGVSRILTGERTTLGLIFHDAR